MWPDQGGRHSPGQGAGCPPPHPGTTPERLWDSQQATPPGPRSPSRDDGSTSVGHAEGVFSTYVQTKPRGICPAEDAAHEPCGPLLGAAGACAASPRHTWFLEGPAHSGRWPSLLRAALGSPGVTQGVSFAVTCMWLPVLGFYTLLSLLSS